MIEISRNVKILLKQVCNSSDISLKRFRKILMLSKNFEMFENFLYFLIKIFIKILIFQKNVQKFNTKLPTDKYMCN